MATTELITICIPEARLDAEIDDNDNDQHQLAHSPQWSHVLVKHPSLSHGSSISKIDENGGGMFDGIVAIDGVAPEAEEVVVGGDSAQDATDKIIKSFETFVDLHKATMLTSSEHSDVEHSEVDHSDLDISDTHLGARNDIQCSVVQPTTVLGQDCSDMDMDVNMNIESELLPETHDEEDHYVEEEDNYLELGTPGNNSLEIDPWKVDGTFETDTLSAKVLGRDTSSELCEDEDDEEGDDEGGGPFQDVDSDQESDSEPFQNMNEQFSVSAMQDDAQQSTAVTLLLQQSQDGFSSDSEVENVKVVDLNNNSVSQLLLFNDEDRPNGHNGNRDPFPKAYTPAQKDSDSCSKTSEVSDSDVESVTVINEESELFEQLGHDFSQSEKFKPGGGLKSPPAGLSNVVQSAPVPNSPPLMVTSVSNKVFPVLQIDVSTNYENSQTPPTRSGNTTRSSTPVHSSKPKISSFEPVIVDKDKDKDNCSVSSGSNNNLAQRKISPSSSFRMLPGTFATAPRSPLASRGPGAVKPQTIPATELRGVPSPLGSSRSKAHGDDEVSVDSGVTMSSRRSGKSIASTGTGRAPRIAAKKEPSKLPMPTKPPQPKGNAHRFPSSLPGKSPPGKTLPVGSTKISPTKTVDSRSVILNSASSSGTMNAQGLKKYSSPSRTNPVPSTTNQKSSPLQFSTSIDKSRTQPRSSSLQFSTSIDKSRVQQRSSLQFSTSLDKSRSTMPFSSPPSTNQRTSLTGTTTRPSTSPSHTISSSTNPPARTISAPPPFASRVRPQTLSPRSRSCLPWNQTDLASVGGNSASSSASTRRPSSSSSVPNGTAGKLWSTGKSSPQPFSTFGSSRPITSPTTNSRYSVSSRYLAGTNNSRSVPSSSTSVSSAKSTKSSKDPPRSTSDRSTGITSPASTKKSPTTAYQSRSGPPPSPIYNNQSRSANASSTSRSPSRQSPSRTPSPSKLGGDMSFRRTPSPKQHHLQALLPTVKEEEEAMSPTKSPTSPGTRSSSLCYSVASPGKPSPPALKVAKPPVSQFNPWAISCSRSVTSVEANSSMVATEERHFSALKKQSNTKVMSPLR